MKCYKHPTEEAVGICSNCGRGICKKCMETKARKFLCKECLEIKPALRKVLMYNLIGTFLGWLGAINSFIMGFYIVATYLAITPLLGTERLVYPTYIAVILTVTLAFVLVYGGYLLWKSNTKKGGIINLVAGTILMVIYLYFTFISRPRLLSWLGFTGSFLFTPAIISGTLGIVMKR